eukprot:gnl/Spiro4/3935_TR1957_c0_g1_i1.p1 gnl/Spiro4/3935_TR1957_c0_g1~~gnl/Spiro4/3935_TR1957_c0_g1_i1.p1  ORF type:complete len:391 (+),score=95.17 gnl/Spiro4/3935_TR1957_c0_g1_i1:58-1173(+)
MSKLREAVERQETKLWKAVRLGDATAVEELVSPNCGKLRNKKDETLLHVAVESGELDVCRLLLDRGCSVDAINKQGDTVLVHYVRSGSAAPELLELLLSRHPNINAQNKSGETVLHWVVQLRYSGLLPMLIERRPNRALANRLGLTAFHVAAMEGLLEEAKLLFEKSILSMRDNDGFNAAELCALCDQETVLDWILFSADGGDNEKVGLTGRRSDRSTVLHHAARQDRAAAVKLILARTRSDGGFINQQDVHGDTALHVAAREGHVRIVELLREHHADDTLRNVAGRTPTEELAHAGAAAAAAEEQREAEELEAEVQKEHTPAQLREKESRKAARESWRVSCRTVLLAMILLPGIFAWFAMFSGPGSSLRN